MPFTSPIYALGLLAATTLVAADFYIIQQACSYACGDWENPTTCADGAYQIMPHQYSCSTDAVAGVDISVDFPDPLTFDESDPFGQGPLEFWRNGDNLEGFKYGGDGTRIAYCWPSSGDKYCAFGGGSCSISNHYYCEASFGE
ncbi:hypothetical protein HD806DRAFT_235349 [Xylariaceae sp. AK1471]|nr:hypothetical protein HD806DRAFT_235349 [Xylariaceae sp. AK1471]